MPAASVDLTLSSHAVSDISGDVMTEYLKIITRMTRKHFFYVGHSRAAKLISQLVKESDDGLSLVEMRPSDWNCKRSSKVSEVECLYRCGRS
jgi:hypothetical protein